MEWIIKPGFFNRRQVGRVQPGLDLSQAIGDFLIKHGILCREKCCGYKFNGTHDAYTNHELAASAETFTLSNTCTRMNVIGTSENENEDLTVILPPCEDGLRITVFIPFATVVTFNIDATTPVGNMATELDILGGATFDFMCINGTWSLISMHALPGNI